jgi:proline racemase
MITLSGDGTCLSLTTTLWTLCSTEEKASIIHEFKLEAPAGVIPIRALCHQNKVIQITLQNAPSYVRHHNVSVSVPFLGAVDVDIVYSGMWYCIVDLFKFSQEILKNIFEFNQYPPPPPPSSSTLSTDDRLSYYPPLSISPSNGKMLCRVGEMIKVACREQYPVTHEEINYSIQGVTF